ncbi:hypothetical protein V7S43_016848 [Phytophthora oleae]|uniref:Transmembrane protein n=1 Tax=Phytophthora oleae TaxID=2107226 RepID=A0ABD3EUT3_9STRA
MGNVEAASHIRSPSSPSLNPIASRTSSWSRAEKKWNRAQVGHQGSYSVERLELLARYCDNTSVLRVILVCLLTPLPSLTVAIGLECLPLRPPSEGWASNWMFWIRLTLMVFTMNIPGASQANLFVPGFNKTAATILTESVIVCALQVGTFLLEAVIFGFPVPFLWQIGAISMGIYVSVVTRLVYGPAVFVKDSALGRQYKRFLDSFLVGLTLIGIYPLCRVLYDFIPPHNRWVVVLIIPLWKFAAKRFAVRMTRELEDFIPELVVFSVDFFSALFVSICMSTAGSFSLTALFIAVDIFFAIIKFREVHKNEKILLKLLNTRRRHATSGLRARLAASNNSELIPMLLEVVRAPFAFHVSSLDRVRLWASPPHLIPEELYKRLQTLAASGIFSGCPSDVIRVSSGPAKRVMSWKFQQISVVPVPLGSNVRITSKLRKGSSARPNEPSKYLVIHGLQLLFHCEYLVLVEYIECVVPLVFVAYKSILEQSPNVIYFPGGAGQWGMATVINLLLFAALEIGSLVLLHVFLRWKFRFSPLYQLAFVLETQFYAVQAHLFPVTIFLLQYQLAHMGADFTFHFDWLRKK